MGRYYKGIWIFKSADGYWYMYGSDMGFNSLKRVKDHVTVMLSKLGTI